MKVRLSLAIHGDSSAQYWVRISEWILSNRVDRRPPFFVEGDPPMPSRAARPITIFPSLPGPDFPQSRMPSLIQLYDFRRWAC